MAQEQFRPLQEWVARARTVMDFNIFSVTDVVSFIRFFYRAATLKSDSGECGRSWLDLSFSIKLNCPLRVIYFSEQTQMSLERSEAKLALYVHISR